MAENTSKRVFPADIFAEDNDKWLWSVPSTNAKSSSIPNYAALRKATKEESGSSSGSEAESAYHNDSNSLKRSFRKRSSSNSEENPPEDVSSSSPRQSSSLPHERLLPPSMYDDDARSASPSTYAKKDFSFASSFHKEFYPTAPESQEASPLSLFEHKIDKSANSKKNGRSKESSPNESSWKNSKTESQRSKVKKTRSRSRERKSLHGSQSRSPIRSRHARSPVREKRRSRSKERPYDRERHSSRSRSKTNYSRNSKRRSRSRDSRRQTRSHSRESKKARSRSRDHRRSRSHSRGYRRSRSRSFDRHNRSRYRSSSRERYRRKHYSRSRSRSRDRSKTRSGSGNRKPGSLPLSTSGGAMTPQMALQQTMAAMNAKAQALTGIALPKYYNPAAVNPLKYAEQVQKRKLLWQSTEKIEEQPKSTVWDKLTFAQDQDGKMTAKFRKLMGIKSETPVQEPPEVKESALKKQEEIFRDLDQQYEMARMTTHTQRGVGLGYSAQTIFPPVPK